MRKLISVLIVAILLYSCLDKETFPVEPVIVYESMAIDGNDVIVKFTFTDGDGDIGLKDDELYYPFGDCDKYNKNLIVDPYYFKDGEFVLGRFIRKSDCPGKTYDTLGFDQRIKYIVPEGNNKTLQGDIYVTLNQAILTLPDDTIKFKLTLIDRLLHKSNEIETETIITPPL